MEKVVAVQNNHYEKLNQLENLLTLIIKKMNCDASCKDESITTEMRLRDTTVGNILNNPATTK